MRKIAALFAFVASISHTRRLQLRSDALERNQKLEKALEAAALLLQRHKEAAAFSPSGPGAHFPARHPTFKRAASTSMNLVAQRDALKLLTDTAGDDIRGIVSADAANSLMPESAYWIGVAFREWLDSSGSIVAGHDPRTHSGDIVAAFCRGANAENAGPATTPAMLESLLEPSSPYAGSVMVTASHLPSEWNGLKLFSRKLGRGLNKKEVNEVMNLAVKRVNNRKLWKNIEPLDNFMSVYIDTLRAAVREAAKSPGDESVEEKPLSGVKICVNAGNGAGGFFAKDVLEPLGADISSSINLEPDGTFPNHLPNPENNEHVMATVNAVSSSGAEVGVMLDTDGDRCGLIDGCRSPPEPVNKNRLIALCATVALEAAGGAGVIVTDALTSQGMGDFISESGGVHDRYKVGYRNVIDRAAETKPEPALLAIETSGHSAWRDNAFVDDGCYTAARLLGRLARARREKSAGDMGLLDILEDKLQEPAESIKVKMNVAGGLSAVADAEAALCDALRKCAEATPDWNLEKVNHDGLRCAVGRSGWLIIRGSLHEPSVSVQTESDDEFGTAVICKTLLAFAAEGGDCETKGIDLQPMRDEAEKAAAKEEADRLEAEAKAKKEAERAAAEMTAKEKEDLKAAEVAKAEQTRLAATEAVTKAEADRLAAEAAAEAEEAESTRWKAANSKALAVAKARAAAAAQSVSTLEAAAERMNADDSNVTTDEWNAANAKALAEAKAIAATKAEWVSTLEGDAEKWQVANSKAAEEAKAKSVAAAEAAAAAAEAAALATAEAASVAKSYEEAKQSRDALRKRVPTDVGPFAPAVRAAKRVMGDQELIELRADIIRKHTKVISNFIDTSESRFGQLVLSKMFEAADKDGSGALDKEELRDALYALGFTFLKDKDVEKIMKKADRDKNEVIDFEEFVKETPKVLRVNLVKLAKSNGHDLGFLV